MTDTVTPSKGEDEPRKSDVEALSHEAEKLEGTVDLQNHLAYKSDNSDGKVEWNIRGRIAAMCLCLCYLSVSSNLYLISGCLTFVAEELNAPGAISWIPVSNTLATAVAAPFTGYLQDLLGRRYITIIGMIVVIIGCAIAGTAHGLAQCVAGMAISGAGAAVCELSALAGLSDIVPVKYRGYIIALMTAAIYPLTPCVLYGQLLASRATWRWCQWIAAIYTGLVLLGITFTYFPQGHPRMEGLSRRKILSQIDYVGAFLSITGLTLFLVALQSGGAKHEWSSAYVLCQLLIGLALLAVWLVWELKFCKWPMLPREIFQDQYVVGIAMFISFIGGLFFYSLNAFFPVTFTTMFESTPIEVGLRVFGYSLAGNTSATLLNILMSAGVEPRYAIATAIVIMTTFTGALATASPYTPTMLAVLGAMAGLGAGAVLNPPITVALFVVPDSLLATTAAWGLSLRFVGGSIGYSIYYSIFANKLKQKLPAEVTKYSIEAGLSLTDATEFVGTFLTAPANITSAPGYSPAIAQAAALGVRWAYCESLKYVWYSAVPFGVVSLVACLFLPNIKKYRTQRIAVKLA